MRLYLFETLNGDVEFKGLDNGLGESACRLVIIQLWDVISSQRHDLDSRFGLWSYQLSFCVLELFKKLELLVDNIMPSWHDLEWVNKNTKSQGGGPSPVVLGRIFARLMSHRQSYQGAWGDCAKAHSIFMLIGR